MSAPPTALAPSASIQPPPADRDALAVPTQVTGPAAESSVPVSADSAPPVAKSEGGPTGLTALPSRMGPIGLLHISTAEVGAPRQLRVGLHGEYFGANDFLIEGDANQRLAGGLVFGYTPRRDLELFGAVLNSSNRNQRNRNLDDRDPELIKTFGDLVLGGKWVLAFSPAATFGVEVGLKFLSGVSDLAVSPRSTSWWLGPAFTYDMRRAAGAVPLRVHAATSFFADNSGNLHNLSVPRVTRATKEVAMFAYGMGPSRLRFALAVDAPLDKLFPRVPINPFIEYHVAYVTADADSDFQDFMKPNCNSSDPAKMPCIQNRDLQWLTVGARAGVFRGITAHVGIDIRIRSPGFPYGPPVPPWNFMFGASYPLDLDGLGRPVVVTRAIEKAPPTGDGHVEGIVHGSHDKAPVAGAVVAVRGRQRSRVVTDPDGGFATAPLPAGPIELEVVADSFEPTKAQVTVVAGQPVQIALALTPSPLTAHVRGRVTTAGGAGMEAAVRFAGDHIHEARSDQSGAYAVALPLGPYRVRASAPGMGAKDAQIDLVRGQDKHLDFVLRPPAPNPNVSLSAAAIKLRSPIRFVGATATLTPGAERILDGVADVLDVHPEIKQLRIIAHWDGSLQKEAAVTLTDLQAQAVRAYLIRRGVSQGRLAASGAGSSQPVVPNLNAMNRARNRRVDLRLD